MKKGIVKQSKHLHVHVKFVNDQTFEQYYVITHNGGKGGSFNNLKLNKYTKRKRKKN